MLKIILVFIVLFCLIAGTINYMTSLNEEETYKHLKVIGKFWVISLIAFVILASIVILF